MELKAQWLRGVGKPATKILVFYINCESEEINVGGVPPGVFPRLGAALI